MKYFTLLIMILAGHTWAKPCGLEGTIEERIRNCNFSKGEFVLTVRDEKGTEIYKELKTGLFWGDRIPTDFNHYGSQRACNNDLLEDKLLKEVKWRLPSIREFEVAASHGMKESLPRMIHTFWTSTPVRSKRKYSRRNAPPAQAYLWDGSDQRSETGDLKDAASVRCVGK